MKRNILLFTLMLSAGFSQSPQQVKLQPITESIHFRLAPDGIRPAQVTIATGKYLIQIDNGLVSADLQFVLDDEANKRVAQANLNRNSSRTRRQVEFTTPGRHKLSVVGQPDWRSEIIVLPAAVIK